jgi:hypothetical protein
MANETPPCRCGSQVSYLNVALTCAQCKSPICEQCATPFDGRVFCKECAERFRQINLLPEPPESEDDF